MNRATENKIVLVTRQTRLAELVARFNTVQQARFYIEHLGADFADYLKEDQQYQRAIGATQNTLERLGRVHLIDRGFLSNYLFGAQDTVVVLGQDGLVANTVKYLSGQPVIGVNPDPDRWDGQLLPFKVSDLGDLLPEVFAEGRQLKEVTMARAELNTGEVIYAVNDLFIGPKSHTSIRYSIQLDSYEERQSSSGVIVSTGVGSTGWFKSLITGATAISERLGNAHVTLPRPENLSSTAKNTPGQKQSAAARAKRMSGSSLVNLVGFPWDADYLYFTVREPFPTSTTQANLVFGQIRPDKPLQISSMTAESGVIFSDGMESDFLQFNAGTHATIGLAEKKGQLVV